MIVSVVMVLQRIEVLSDREAVDRFAFEARWKYAAGGLDFDYPGFVHTVLVDMRDSEVITSTTVSIGNTSDAEAAGDLLADGLASRDHEASNDAPVGPAVTKDAGGDEDQLAVYGDAAYGAGALLAELDAAGAENTCKVQPPTAPGGRFAKDVFDIDLDAGTVGCPGEQTARIRPAKDGGAPPRSGPCARAACWPRSAPAQLPDGPSRSAPTRPTWPRPVPLRPTRSA